MTYSRENVKIVVILFAILYPFGAAFPERESLKYNSYLPKVEFGRNEYTEYQDDDDKSKIQIWEQVSHVNKMGPEKLSGASMKFPDQFDPNIVWDSKWGSDIKFGQISAVSIDPLGNVVIFHRGNRVWNYDTFDKENRFDATNGPIKENTIAVFDKSGKVIFQWGMNIFYLPHGLTIDSLGNYWITDVAMHQVFKFDAKDIEKHKTALVKGQFNMKNSAFDNHYSDEDTFRNSIIKPSIRLGEAFMPGNDDSTFCKPTAVAVQSNGDFFVSDGYCNSRIIKYNSNGEKILQWGRQWRDGDLSKKSPSNYAFQVPHALALDEETNHIFIADRENGRILCFLTSSGEFYKEYKSPIVGKKIYSVAYVDKKIYLVNGPDSFIDKNEYHIRGFAIDVLSGKVVSQFGPHGDMDNPHDIAVTADGREIYVVELNSHKIFRFLQGVNNTKTNKSVNATLLSSTSLQAASLSESSSNLTSKTTTLLLSVLIATIVLIALCLVTAIAVARCRKRARRRTDWDADRNENFKLSNFLDNRKNKRFRFFDKRPNTRDFNKLSTEPETSDDENLESSLTKII